MKKLIVDANHEKEINEVLKERQGKARERIIDDYNDLKRIIDNCLDELPSLPKHALKDCILAIKIGAGHYPASYGGIPMGTCVTIKFRKDGKAEVTDVGRHHVNCLKVYNWKMTESARDYIMQYYMNELGNGYSLIKSEENN